MNLGQPHHDIRTLFDWRKSEIGVETPAAAADVDDELERALKLLACNPRDREQFRSGRGGA